ncbi:MAG: glycoside hydrolase family 13 protein [Bacilli bacterium]|jgi:glycosidase|nr:glycoside hydrolase family 13 protein [Bacilli bacterium]
MKRTLIEHRMDSPDAFPLSENSFYVRLRIGKGGRFDKVEILYNDKYDFPKKQYRLEMKKKGGDATWDNYEAVLPLQDRRLAYIFRLSRAGRKSFFSEDGLKDNYDFPQSYFNFFQYAFINETDIVKIPSWAKKACFYEIFVDRFNRGDKSKDDSYVNIRWGNKVKTNSFAGGDLKGISDRLDYLAGLGINALYLTPIFLSKSNHKYDTIDYFRIDPEFGSANDLKELVSSAHEKGMHVVLDAVFNHCSSACKEFQDVIKNGSRSPYYDWFIIHGAEVDVRKPNYEMFASCSYMPKINTANPGAAAKLIEVGTRYIKDFGIDGWRLDVSDEVSHSFWRAFRLAMKKANPDCLLIGENWHDSYSYLEGDQFDSIMNYALTKACLDYFASRRFDAAAMAERCNHLLMRNKAPVNSMMLNLLDSHDTTRFLTSLGGNRSRFYAALTFLYFYQGMPCLYYGDEIPLEGDYDPDNRRCFPSKIPEDSFLERIKGLTALRRMPLLQEGDINVEEENGMLKVRRGLGRNEMSLFINLTDERKRPKIGERVLESGWKDGFLEPNGFVIAKGE